MRFDRSTRCAVPFLSAVCLACAPGSAVVGDRGDSNEARGQPLATAFSEVGGSVLAFLRVGAYATQPTDEHWARDVRAAVTSYHEDPDRIREHLRALVAAGQRRVGVILWFTEPIPGRETWMHAIVPRPDGSLPPRARANLHALLSDIDALGFEEVQIRFGPQGGASWQCYRNPACYTDPTISDTPHVDEAVDFTFALIRQVIDDVEALGLRTPRLYDVAAEFMGHPFMVERPGWRRYTERLWELSYARYAPQGVAVNLSFNHAHVAGTEASFDVFDRVGWPETISMDVYENVYGTMGVLGDALARRGRRGFPIFIQETFLNDPTTARELRRAVDDFGLSLRYVMQWPTHRPSVPGATVSHASTEDLSPYDVYLGLRTLELPRSRPDLGRIEAIPPVCRIAHGQSTCTTRVRWQTQGVAGVRVLIDGKLLAAGATGDAEVPWVQQTIYRFDLTANEGYLGSAVVRGLPEGLDVPAPGGDPARGSIRAVPATCVVPPGASVCTATIEWDSENARVVQVRVGHQLFASGTSGRQAATWITEAPATFELVGDGRVLSTVTVRGTRSTPRVLTANPERCAVGPQGLCTSVISWSAPKPAQVFVDGKLFASGQQGSQAAPWIGPRPYVFTVVSGGEVLDRVVVEGHW